MQRQRLATRLLVELAYVALALLALIVASIAGGLKAPVLWTLITIVGAAYLIGRGASRGDWSGLERLGRSPAADTPIAHTPATDAPSDGRLNDDAMTVSEERLIVDKRPRVRERVRLRKYVVTEQVTVTVPVRREHVRLEREPVSEDEPDPVVDEVGAPAADYSITLLEEQIVVDKRVVPRERVSLHKHVVTENEQISEVVRREEVEVEHDEAADG